MKSKIVLILVVLQIFLLVNNIPAYSYILEQTNIKIESLSVNENRFYKILNSGVDLLIGFLSIKQIGIVSAQDVELKCCQDTCMDITFIDGVSETECDNVIETTCDNVAECKPGCCYDEDEGLCSANSPRNYCESDGGKWTNDATCSIEECRKGCCVLGANVKFTTEQNCEIISGSQGFEKDFRQIWNEVECIALAETQFEGACIFGESLCKFETEKECVSDGGRFKQGYLCSHPLLRTNCEKQDHVGCAEGKNEIYWFDSCGNRENIYSSDKDESWNDGKVLSKDESCNSDSDNANSGSCGNCDFPLSKCYEVETGIHIQDGNFVCRNLGCDDASANGGKTQDRVNGEKWCLYEGAIGNGEDTVGSEHWLAYCYNGEVKLEPRNSDYRGVLCQEQTIEEEGNSFTQADYISNEATKCMNDYNPLERNENGEIVRDEEKIQACEENEHCMIQTVDVDDYFSFNVCTAKYPKGADLRDGTDDNLCSSASMSCKVVYKKSLLGWKCEENCDCETKEFAEKMNALCISYGDCGSNINYIGKGTENVNIIGGKGKKLDSNGDETDEESEGVGNFTNILDEIGSDGLAGIYGGNENSVEGEYVGLQNIDDYLEIYGGSEETLVLVGGISGILGGLIYAPKLVPAISATELGTVFGSAITLGPVLVAIGSLAAGVSSASFIAKQLGISGPEATTLIIAGGVAGAGLGLLIIFGFGIENFWNVIGWSLLATGTITALIIAILGVGERETRIVTFECQQWEAPNGGRDCDKCDDDTLIPCTRYKCESLGQLCELINEDDEENRACVSMEKESNPPILSAGKFIKGNYNFKTDNFVDKIIEVEGEVQESYPIEFTLLSDEYAQCKYSFETPSSPYFADLRGGLPLERNSFTLEHSFGFNVPSLDDEVIQDGKLNVYIKCQDGQEPPNFNPDVYVVRFNVYEGYDETVVDFNRFYSEPKNGAVLKYGTSETDLKIWLPENSECSYDINDKTYELMSHEMSCGVEDFYGWPCETKLENLISGENKFYIRCIDENGNVNQESYEYDTFVSKNELQISSISLSANINGKDVSISPEESFVTSLVPLSIIAEVKTSEGADNGKSTCKWGVEESGGRWLMSPYYEFSNIHTQLIPKPEGNHFVYFECEDEAGNVVQKNVNFNIELDSSPAIVSRAYRDGNNLKLITNEEAQCYFDLKSCYFDLEKGIQITTAFSKIHSTQWNPGVSYYVKCKDLLGNINPDCAIKIIPTV